MRIGIVGDLHIAPVPANRLDDYFQAGLNKIQEIASACDKVIFLGDIFTSAKVEPKYVNSLIHHLNYCIHKYNCEFITIVGNHDVVHEEEDNLCDSSLGTLLSSNVIKIILPGESLIIDNYRFNTIPVKYKKAENYIQNLKFSNKTDENTDCIDILLAHHQFESGNPAFSYENFKDLGCKMIFLGHDHKPFDAGYVSYPEFTAYRSGSIMRNKADDYNLTRNLYYFALENNQVFIVPINHANAKDVFSVESYERLEYHKKQFTESIDTLIDKYKNNINTQDKFSIKKTLQGLNISEAGLSYIKSKYDQIQEVFN